jgi:nicotinate-nucleotide--dimethylbenzimidazole phosphoribosyltransferase
MEHSGIFGGELTWLQGPVAPLDANAREQARNRQARLLKPPGALGRLEDLAIGLAAMQGMAMPAAERVRIVLFAADHGVAREGVSAFPQSVTASMLRCFAEGGSAIHVLAQTLGAELEVLDLGTVGETGSIRGVSDARIGPGTANFVEAPAMSAEQLAQALQVGRAAAERARRARSQLLIGGEMGIGNTTAATALASALLNETPEKLAGPGAGLDRAGVRHKIEIVRRGLARHRDGLASPVEVLRRLGGFEIAALVGAYIGCARIGLPVLVDGFICTAAALAAERLCPGCRDWFIFSHVSAEPGHARMLHALAGQPLLDLGMRLGEGSGAAVAVPLLRLACALHAGMATFGDAGVAGRSA